MPERDGRRRRGWTTRTLGVAAIAGLATLGPPAAATETLVPIRGTVTDETGAPLPGQVVRLLKSRTILNLTGFKSRDQNVEDVRTATDEHGFFEFSLTVDPQFRYYYLRFYDPQGFDVVKYRLPEDREITSRVRRGRPVQEAVVLKLQPDWPKVKALVDQYGPASPVGQVLRSLGLPSRRTPQGSGRELWEYDAAKVAYLIEGSKVVETHRLSGTATTAAPATTGDGTSEDRPEPATRVEGP